MQWERAHRYNLETAPVLINQISELRGNVGVRVNNLVATTALLLLVVVKKVTFAASNLDFRNLDFLVYLRQLCGVASTSLCTNIFSLTQPTREMSVVPWP